MSCPGQCPSRRTRGVRGYPSPAVPEISQKFTNDYPDFHISASPRPMDSCNSPPRFRNQKAITHLHSPSPGQTRAISHSIYRTINIRFQGIYPRLAILVPHPDRPVQNSTPPPGSFGTSNADIPAVNPVQMDPAASPSTPGSHKPGLKIYVPVTLPDVSVDRWSRGSRHSTELNRDSPEGQ